MPTSDAGLDPCQPTPVRDPDPRLFCDWILNRRETKDEKGVQRSPTTPGSIPLWGSLAGHRVPTVLCLVRFEDPWPVAEKPSSSGSGTMQELPHAASSPVEGSPEKPCYPALHGKTNGRPLG